jgi:hypothetical protein
MFTPVQNQTTDSEDTETPIFLDTYIKTSISNCPEIVVVESDAPARTRQQLRKSFGGNAFHAALLVFSDPSFKKLQQRLKMQLAKRKHKTVMLPLILIAPSGWPNFHEIMLNIQEMFVGPIFLVDNSQAAANWADRVVSVSARGVLKPPLLAESAV